MVQSMMLVFLKSSYHQPDDPGFRDKLIRNHETLYSVVIAVIGPRCTYCSGGLCWAGLTESQRHHR